MLSIVITILCVTSPELDIVEGIQGIQGKVGPLIQRGDAGGQYKTMKFAINIFVIPYVILDQPSFLVRQINEWLSRPR